MVPWIPRRCHEDLNNCLATLGRRSCVLSHQEQWGPQDLSPTHQEGDKVDVLILSTAFNIICFRPHLSLLKSSVSYSFCSDQYAICWKEEVDGTSFIHCYRRLGWSLWPMKCSPFITVPCLLNQWDGRVAKYKVKRRSSKDCCDCF